DISLPGPVSYGLGIMEIDDYAAPPIQPMGLPLVGVGVALLAILRGMARFTELSPV
ncbi:unnamed protein product, partial [marine sediment metagenome]